MQVVKTMLRCPMGRVVEVSVLFYGGSDRSFIISSLAREQQLRKSREDWFAFSGFGGTGCGPRTKRNIFFLEMGGFPLELTEIPKICADMYKAPVAEHIVNKFEVDFTEDLRVGQPVKIDILIGLDYYWRRLAANPRLKDAYDENLSEIENSGIITEVNDDNSLARPVFYLPHMPVVREDSKTTKVTPVFDASAKGSDSEEGAGRLIAEAKKIMAAAGMELTKWSSNRPDFLL
ncbi:hypothetical protein RRG08_057520 [Elysia crispata]|nr:hypothetical protein RRG08_057520 [Elysia crispata]